MIKKAFTILMLFIVCFVRCLVVYGLEESDTSSFGIDLLSYDVEENSRGISDIKSIYIYYSDVRLNYIEGEDFDSTNLKVIANYDNDYRSEIIDYEIIAGENLQNSATNIVVKKGDFLSEIPVNFF